MVEGIRTAQESDWRQREKSRAKALKNKKVKSIEGERSANGGIIMRHRFDNTGEGPYKDSEEHTFGPDEEAKALAHFAEHMGLGGRKPKQGGEEDTSSDE